MTIPVPLYDAFSAQYDYFVDWAQRLRHEMPFIERHLVGAGARRVLDVACGTGKHALALAQSGYEVVGADLSVGMIEQARKNAAAFGDPIRFVVAGFGNQCDTVGGGFDALLCLGNSLPHVLSTHALMATLADFGAVLRPGGLLLIQSRNFDAVMRGRVRWIGPQSHPLAGTGDYRKQGDHPLAGTGDYREWLFVRFYDFNPDGTLTFNVLSLQRETTGPWSQRAEATTLRPWLRHELQQSIESAGFAGCVCYGGMEGAPFDAACSSDLVIVAFKV